MSELKENQLVFVDDDGTEVLCDIIFTYHSDEFAKDYVFFAPVDSVDEDGRVEVACASYVPTDGGVGELSQIETEEEWNLLSTVFEKYAEDYENSGCGCGCDDCEDCDDCDDCEDGCDCCEDDE